MSKHGKMTSAKMQRREMERAMKRGPHPMMQMPGGGEKHEEREKRGGKKGQKKY